MRLSLVIFFLLSLASAQTVVTQFEGDSGTGGSSSTAPTYKDHPDATIAEGNNYILEVTGQDVNVYTTAGATTSSTDFVTWYTAAGVTCTTRTDPRVSYDTFISRFIVVESCSTGGDYIIVSSSNNLSTATWKSVSISSTTGDLTMRPGFDKNGVYVTEFIPGSSPIKYVVFAFPSADLAWSGGGAPSISNLQTFTPENFEVNPVTDLNASKAATDPELFVALSSPQATANVAFNLLVDKLVWPNGGVGGACTNGTGAAPCATYTTGAASIVSGFNENLNVNEPQPSGGASIRTNESVRIFGYMQQVGSHLYIVRGTGPCTASCGTQGVDTHQLFFWWDVDPVALTITQKGKVSDANLGYYFPVLAADASGNLLIAAGGISSTKDASIYSWYRLTGDPLGTLRGATLVKDGTQVMTTCNNGTTIGWGTYYNGVQDGDDPTKVWIVEGYAASTTPCQWHTRILQLSTGAPSSVLSGGFTLKGVMQ